MSEFVSIEELKEHGGEVVRLRGWLAAKRSSGKVAFLQLRDGTGTCQCVVEAAAEQAFAVADELTMESSLMLTGEVRLDDRAPGGCEINVTELAAISIAEEYPIARKSHGVDFLMHHRHLWFRSPRQTAILRIRHTIIDACRSFFNGQGFTLIDTPILSTGAGEDSQSLFPVEYFGDEAFLAQTGQLYLESACMALGKVYCFGPTFRAEKSKTRRHLTEFWMLEPEVAFAELDDLIELAEDMTVSIVEAVLEKHRADLELLGRDIGRLEDIKKPFPRITYTEAAEILRSDDTRDVLVAAMERDQKRLKEMKDQEKQLESQIAGGGKKWKVDKWKAEQQDLHEAIQELEQDLATQPDHIELARNFEWGKDLGGSDETILSKMYDRPLFVTEYPKEAKAFYMKVSDQDDRVVRNLDMLAPEGYGEVIGGSQREERLDVLLERIAGHGLDADDYQWYLDLRRYGSVPHGGYGLGIERTVSWICGLKHVRETIPFPRMMGKLYP